MAVLEFGFHGGDGNPHSLRNHKPGDVVYTGTHDNQPLAGWWKQQRASVREQIPLDGEEPHWALIRLALSLAVAPRDRPGAGRARPRRRGAHEHARPRPTATGAGACARAS